MDRKAPAIAQNIWNWATTNLVGGWNRATLPHVFTGRLPPGYWAVLTNTSHYIQQIWMLRYFFCKVICICQNSSVAGRQPPGEDVGEGCSVPATYQIGRSSISNILGNSWGLPIHVLRVVWICSLLWGRRFATPSWLRLDRPHKVSRFSTSSGIWGIGTIVTRWSETRPTMIPFIGRTPASKAAHLSPIASEKS